MSESTDKPLPDEPLDEYLKGDSSVSRHYRQLHGMEVPAEIDHLVLRQAEEAVQRRPADRAAKWPAWVRWSTPLALAASAVLVLSIVIETGVQDETMRLQAQKPAMKATQRQRAHSETPENVVAEQAAPASAAAPSADAATPPVTARNRPPASRAAAPKVSEQSVADVAAVAEQELKPASAVAEVERKENSAFAAEAAREEAPAAVTQREMRVEQDQASQRDTATTPSTPPAELAYARRISVDMPPSARSYSDPEAWLKDIRQLRKQNKQEEADREWRRFRAAFPKYEVAETDVARQPTANR